MNRAQDLNEIYNNYRSNIINEGRYGGYNNRRGFGGYDDGYSARKERSLGAWDSDGSDHIKELDLTKLVRFKTAQESDMHKIKEEIKRRFNIEVDASAMGRHYEARVSPADAPEELMAEIVEFVKGLEESGEIKLKSKGPFSGIVN